jgi:hypothetical protein
MARAGGYVLYLEEGRREIYEQSIELEGIFSQPVPDFLHTRTAPLISFVVLDGRSINHIAKGRRGIVSGTELRRLNIQEPHALRTAIPIADVVAAIDSRHRGRARDTLENGGYFSPKAFEATIEAISAVSEEARPLLSRFGRTRRELIGRLRPNTRRALGEQKEVVLSALAFADLDRRQIHDWEPPTQGEPSSFLDGLPAAVMREDAMIVNDLMNVPGFDVILTLPYSAAVFQGIGKRLTVLLANRLPLEQLTGTDLIYYNETYRSYVMVQYKAMDSVDNVATFRLPSPGLVEEIDRMRALEATLNQIQIQHSKENYRLCAGPFYIKLCSRVQFNPDDIKLFPGMYFSLAHWSHISNDTQLIGPRGGRVVTYENVGRHIENDLFIKLVANAWIGTHAEQSAVLEQAIRGTIESGRALALAIESRTAEEQVA